MLDALEIEDKVAVAILDEDVPEELAAFSKDSFVSLDCPVVTTSQCNISELSIRQELLEYALG